MATEDRFPTIRDARDRLTSLVDDGLGDHPVQVLVVPDSTLQAIAMNAIPKDAVGISVSDKPALMVDVGGDGGRMGFLITSTERWERGGGGMPTRSKQ